MIPILEKLREKLARDRAIGVRKLARKSVIAAAEYALAPLYLHAVDRVGHRPRTMGRPRIDNAGEMELGDDVVLRSVNVPAELVTGPFGRLVVGSSVFINYGVSIAAMQEITLGDRVRIGPYVMIVDTDFHEKYDRAKRPEPKPVRIDDDVWIGAKASILRGVHIGRGAIIGTGAVVNKDVEAFTVVGGVPAKVLERLDPEAMVLPESARATKAGGQ